MTTCIYDRRTKTLGADSRNTDSAGTVYELNKIEELPNGMFFLGSGHCYTISKVRYWAAMDFSEDERPEFNELFDEGAEDYSMTCIIISADGEKVIMMDDEITPMEIDDDFVCIGSGGGLAKGAMCAGATVEQALAIAKEHDGNTGGKLRTRVIVPKKGAKHGK